jgi:hypothetical protein
MNGYCDSSGIFTDIRQEVIETDLKCMIECGAIEVCANSKKGFRLCIEKNLINRKGSIDS